MNRGTPHVTVALALMIVLAAFSTAIAAEGTQASPLLDERACDAARDAARITCADAAPAPAPTPDARESAGPPGEDQPTRDTDGDDDGRDAHRNRQRSAQDAQGATLPVGLPGLQLSEGAAPALPVPFTGPSLQLPADALTRAGAPHADRDRFATLRDKLLPGLDAPAAHGALSDGGRLHVLVEYAAPGTRDAAAIQGLQSFASDASPLVADRVARAIEAAGGEVLREFTLFPIVEAEVDARGLLEVAGSDDVRHVHLVQPKRPALYTAKEAALGVSPDDFAASHGLDGTGVTIAILDTGIDPNHPDFAGRIADFSDFVGDADGVTHDGAENAYDDHGHGTHVASIAAGSGAASNGAYEGIAPGATIMAGRVLSQWGGDDATVMAGIEWALDPNGDGDTSDGADIISMSLGGPCGGPCDGTDVLSLAVNDAVARGAVVVVAAGNSGPTPFTVDSPGVAAGAITVGALDDRNTRGQGDDHIASFSSRGPSKDVRAKPDVLAPGANITAAQWDSDGYVTYSGTSMATPAVSGLAALILQQHGAATPAEVKARLASTALPTEGANPFNEGMGAVRGVDAVDATIAFDTATTDLGALYRRADALTTDVTVDITNLGAAQQTITLGVAETPPGVIADLATPGLTIAPGATEQARLTVTVDPAATPAGGHAVLLRADNGTATTHHRVTFHQYDTAELTPFKADSDADLDALAGAGVFDGGSGTPDDPYRITDRLADGAFADGAIVRIANTTKSVRIDTVRFENVTEAPAIHLHNVANVAINGSDFISGHVGVLVENSTAVAVTHSLFGGNWDLGLVVANSTAFDASNNTFAFNGGGMRVHQSAHGALSDNLLVFNVWDGGLLIEDSTRLTLRANELAVNFHWFFFNGDLAIDWSDGHHLDHDIDTSNLVNGLPVYHQYGGAAFELVGTEAAPEAFGDIIIANVTSVRLENLTSWTDDPWFGPLSGAGFVVLFNVDSAILRNVSLDHYTHGYALIGARNVELTEANMTNGNSRGVYIAGFTGDADDTIDYAASQVTIKDSAFNELPGNAVHAVLADNVTVQNVTVQGAYAGIIAQGVADLRVENATLEDLRWGIALLDNVTRAKVANATLSSYLVGLDLDALTNEAANAPTGVIAQRNTFSGGEYGVLIRDGASGNNVTFNNLYSHGGESAWDDGAAGGTAWDTPTGGNYWSEHVRPAWDGIVSNSRSIPGLANADDDNPLAAPVGSGHEWKDGPMTIERAKLPQERHEAPAVWTGREVLVFGGQDYDWWDATYQDLHDIVRYDPATGDVTTSNAALPMGARGAAAVWNGTHALIFGGQNATAGYLDTILAYDPVSDTITDTGHRLPVGRSGAAAVWNGTHALVLGGWGGSGIYQLDDVVAYDPATGAVDTLGVRLPTPVNRFAAVWDGARVIAFGGWDGGNRVDAIVAVDPAALTATTMGTALPRAHHNLVGVWDGRHAYLLGGSTESGGVARILRYDPVADRIEAMATPLLEARASMGAVWTGEQIIFLGGYYYTEDIGTYTPSMDGALPLMQFTGATLPQAPVNGATAWTGAEAYTFGGHPDSTWINTIQKVDPATGTAMDTGHDLPVAMRHASAVWNGTHAFIFGGQDANLNGLDTVLRYDPATGAVDAMTATLPTPRAGSTAVWNGTHALVLGGYDENSDPLDEVLAYHPETDSVTALPTPLSFTVAFAGAMWVPDAQAAYVFGGYEGTWWNISSTITRYDPAAGEATAMDAELPCGRADHAATFDGTYAYIIGGYDRCDNEDIILRYDPQRDAVEAAAASVGSMTVPSAWSNGTHIFAVNDNARVFQHAVSPPPAPPAPTLLPDLEVTALNITPTVPIDGDLVTFGARVENTGDADAGEFNVSFGMDGWWSTVTVTGLGAGATVDVTSDAWSSTAGTHYVAAIADYEWLLPEHEDYWNNYRELTFEVHAPPAPDLVIPADRVVIDPTPAVGRESVITFPVVNAGGADAEGAGVSLVVDGAWIGESLVGAVPAGGETMHSIAWTPEAAGPVTAMLNVEGVSPAEDDAGAANNALDLGVTVDEAPGLSVTASLSDAEVTTGNTVQVTATVTHGGSPVEGADVTVRVLATSIDGAGVTDASGGFSLPVDTTGLTGQLLIRVNATDGAEYATDTLTVTVQASGSPGTPYTVAGDVLDRDTGAIVAGAAVVVTDVANGMSVGTVSGDDGAYSVDLSGIGYADGDSLKATADDGAGRTGANTSTVDAAASFTLMDVRVSDAVTHAIAMAPGWNLVAIPVTPDAPLMASHVVAATGATTVARYDSAAGSFETYLVVGDRAFGTDFELVPGVGYFVRVDADATLDVTGAPVTGITYQLTAGWNLVGHPFDDGATASTLTEASDMGATSVSRFDTGTGSYQTLLKSGDRTFGTDFPLSLLEGYFVNVPEDATVEK